MSSDKKQHAELRPNQNNLHNLGGTPFKTVKLEEKKDKVSAFDRFTGHEKQRKRHEFYKQAAKQIALNYRLKE